MDRGNEFKKGIDGDEYIHLFDRSFRLGFYISVLVALIMGVFGFFLVMQFGNFGDTAGAPYWNDFMKNFGNVILSIVTGYIASALLFFLFGYSVDKKMRTVVAAEVEKSVSPKIERMIKDFSRNAAPAAVYDKSKIPTEAFRKDFSLVCGRSKKYIFHGVGGDFTAFRLEKMISSSYVLDKEEIVISLLDPRDGRFLKLRARSEAESRGGGKLTTDQMMQDIQEEILCSMVALFDVSREINIKVVFYKESSFFRAELFDDAIFISFYLGGDFPGTYQYSKNTHMYNAFEMAMREIRDISKCYTMSASDFDDQRLIRVLKELKLVGGKDKVTLAELREKKKKRFESIERNIARGFSLSEPF